MKVSNSPPVAWVWAFSLLAAWMLIAWQLDQSIFRSQRSQDLVAYGAFKGENLTAADAWRLVASQWLHVEFLHMLFNALVIALLGQALQRRTSIGVMVLIGIGGGAVGQYFSAVASPSSYVSGASQAYLALGGATLLLFIRSNAAWWMAVVATMVAAALDLFVGSHGAIKVGHAAAFVAGISGGASIIAKQRLRRLARLAHQRSVKGR